MPGPVGFVDMPQPQQPQPGFMGGPQPVPAGPGIGAGFPIAPSGSAYPNPYGNQPVGPFVGNYPPQSQLSQYPQQPATASNQSHAPAGMYLPPANPTVRPYQPFNPSEDAQKLYKAMKGIGTNETTLIEILCQRTSPQRQEIIRAYKSAHGKDLIKTVQSETSKEFEQVLVALLKTPAVFEAENLRDSIAGIGTREEKLIEILVTKTNDEMNALKNAYKQRIKN